MTIQNGGLVSKLHSSILLVCSCLTKHYKCTVNSFFKQLTSTNDLAVESLYFKTWNQLKLRRLEKHNNYIKSIPFCDFKAFDSILKYIPTTTNQLHLTCPPGYLHSIPQVTPTFSPSCTSQVFSPVDGFMVGKVLPLTEFTHSSLMNIYK